MRAAIFVAGALCCAMAPPAKSEEQSIEPRQLLASLQRVQDSIAAGDISALPAQRQLIAMLDESFAKQAEGGHAEPPDVTSILIFALSGGNKRAASTLISHIPEDSPKHALAVAVSAYVNGDAAAARTGFEPIDPLSLDARLAPFVALAKGTSSLGENDGVARRQFDIARLLSPGTLVEEVALRRLMALHVKAADAASFGTASRQYARRYIGSPYGRQFAEVFVDGCIGLNLHLAAGGTPAILEGVPNDYRTSLYLRLARQAAIAGRFELSVSASNEVMKEKEFLKGGRLNAQVRLYAAIAALSTGSAEDARVRLEGINEGALPNEDAALLGTAKLLAEAILKPLDRMAAVRKQPEPIAARAEEAQANPPAGESQKNDAAAKADAFVSAVRGKFDAIDQLLGEASR
jgi:chemotaxis protein MotC